MGHMAVAYIAYQRLDPDVKQRADLLVRLNPYYEKWKAALPSGLPADEQKAILFMIAAEWADQIKLDLKYYKDGYRDDGCSKGGSPPAVIGITDIGYDNKANHWYWHFDDRGFSKDGTPFPPAPSPNVDTQSKFFVSLLQSDQPNELKSYAMVWLMHLVGDLHQPVHTVNRYSSDMPEGDAGANRVKITTPSVCLSKLTLVPLGRLSPSASAAAPVPTTWILRLFTWLWTTPCV